MTSRSRAWVHAMIARNMGFRDAVGLVDHLEERMDGQPECYGSADDVICIRPCSPVSPGVHIARLLREAQ